MQWVPCRLLTTAKQHSREDLASTTLEKLATQGSDAERHTLSVLEGNQKHCSQQLGDEVIDAQLLFSKRYARSIRSSSLSWPRSCVTKHDSAYDRENAQNLLLPLRPRLETTNAAFAAAAALTRSRPNAIRSVLPS